MRVLVFGRLPIMQRVTELLREEGIIVISISNGFAELIDLLKPDEFSLAILDCCAEQTEVAYYRISELGAIPIVFMMSDRRADWKRIQSLDAIGYLPVQAGNRELATRLRVILRHCLTHKQTEKSNPRHIAYGGPPQ
ncbi:hypothetical protein ACFLVO_04470 [Chloroflexota bacterium]